MSNEYEENEEDDGATTPLPVPEKPVLTRSQIKRRCAARLGIEADELDALYPKDEDLLDFYTNTAMKMSELDGSFEGEEAEADTYKLSASEQAAADSIKLELRREQRKQKKETLVKEKTAFEKAGAHLAPESKVSYAEARKAMRDLLNTPDEV
jgi:hypothetical protein